MNMKQIVIELQTALGKLCPPTYTQLLGVLVNKERRVAKVSTRVSLGEAHAIRRIRPKRKH